MLKIKESIKKAQVELRFLLNRGYRKKVALEFVANHHQLTRSQRNILVRTVFSKEDIKSHKKTKTSIEEIKKRKLGIDGYNVLITIESIIDDKHLKCDDGFIRDIKASFGNYEINDKTKEALKLIKKLFNKHEPNNVTFLYDKPVSKSGELAGLTRHILKNFNTDAKTVKNVDLKLREYEVVASSDRGVIEHSEKVIDLPKSILNMKKS